MFNFQYRPQFEFDHHDRFHFCSYTINNLSVTIWLHKTKNYIRWFEHFSSSSHRFKDIFDTNLLANSQNRKFQNYPITNIRYWMLNTVIWLFSFLNVLILLLLCPIFQYKFFSQSKTDKFVIVFHNFFLEFICHFHCLMYAGIRIPYILSVQCVFAAYAKFHSKLFSFNKPRFYSD